MIDTAADPKPRRYSLVHLVLLVPWVALVIDAFAPIRDNSFLWHVRAGALQVEGDEVLTADPFSFTMFGEQWLTQSWLAELGYSWGESVSELGFVAPMMLLTTTVTFVGLSLVAYRCSRSVTATAIILLLSTALMLSFLVPRPVIFSFALFVLVILVWERPAARWTLPLLFWIWASVHGSFAIGLAYVGLSVLARKEWRALPTMLVSGLATLLTAHGLGVVTMLIDFAQARETLALLTEWRRPELISLVFTPFLIGVGIIVYGGFRKRIRPGDAWILVPFLILAFGATRAVPPSWMALVPMMATSLVGMRIGLVRRFSRPIAAGFVVLVLLFPFFLITVPTIDESRFPVAAAAELRNVNTFHDDRAGGFLIWKKGPEFLVYLDDRAELYRSRMAEYVEIRNAEIDWRPVFERDGIEQVLLRTDERLIADLSAAEWAETYRDEEYVILRPS